MELQDLRHVLECDDKSVTEERFGPLITWLKESAEGLLKLGVDINGAELHEQTLRDAGFINRK